MTAILITGMSGTGKSTVLAALADRGYPTVDTDLDDWIDETGPERLLRLDRLTALLDDHESAGMPLFVAGTVANQRALYPRFAEIVLLSAPLPVMMARIATRDTNPFGRTEDERARIISDTEVIEPLLRASATVELDTRAPLAETVERLARLATRVSKPGRQGRHRR